MILALLEEIVYVYYFQSFISFFLILLYHLPFLLWISNFRVISMIAYASHAELCQISNFALCLLRVHQKFTVRSTEVVLTLLFRTYHVSNLHLLNISLELKIFGFWPRCSSSCRIPLIDYESTIIKLYLTKYCCIFALNCFKNIYYYWLLKKIGCIYMVTLEILALLLELHLILKSREKSWQMSDPFAYICVISSTVDVMSHYWWFCSIRLILETQLTLISNLMILE